MVYKIAVPRSRNYTNTNAPHVSFAPTDAYKNQVVSDIILHSLIVRIAYNDGHTEEFNTKLLDDNTVEIDIPQDRLDNILNVQIGEKVGQFIAWLTSREELIPKTVIIVSSCQLKLYNTITTALVDASNQPILIYLPTPNPNYIINIKRIDNSPNMLRVIYDKGTIDGESWLDIKRRHESFQLVSDAINYYII